MEKMIKAFLLTIAACVLSFLIFGVIIDGMFNYSSVEASYHHVTHALFPGLIFTVIFSTILILDKLDKLKKDN